MRSHRRLCRRVSSMPASQQPLWRTRHCAYVDAPLYTDARPSIVKARGKFSLHARRQAWHLMPIRYWPYARRARRKRVGGRFQGRFSSKTCACCLSRGRDRSMPLLASRRLLVIEKVEVASCRRALHYLSPLAYFLFLRAAADIERRLFAQQLAPALLFPLSLLSLNMPITILPATGYKNRVTCSPR